MSEWKCHQKEVNMYRGIVRWWSEYKQPSMTFIFQAGKCVTWRDGNKFICGILKSLNFDLWQMLEWNISSTEDGLFSLSFFLSLTLIQNLVCESDCFCQLYSFIAAFVITLFITPFIISQIYHTSYIKKTKSPQQASPISFPSGPYSLWPSLPPDILLSLLCGPI